MQSLSSNVRSALHDSVIARIAESCTSWQPDKSTASRKQSRKYTTDCGGYHWCKSVTASQNSQSHTPNIQIHYTLFKYWCTASEGMLLFIYSCAYMCVWTSKACTAVAVACQARVTPASLYASPNHIRCQLVAMLMTTTALYLRPTLLVHTIAKQIKHSVALWTHRPVKSVQALLIWLLEIIVDRGRNKTNECKW